MEEKDYQILLFNYYRDAELQGADLLARLLQHTDDPDLQIKLTRHLADEARHAWLWTERIMELGGKVTRVSDGYQRQLRKRVGIPTSVLDLLALTYVVEERAQKRYREHAVRPGVDPKTAALIQAMNEDEEWHLTWVGEKLKELEDAEGKGRCAAALARYRALENEVYAQLETEEKRVSARA
jgi:rubrerythrin